MKKFYVALLGATLLISCDLSKYRLVENYNFETVFESSKGKETATYRQIIDFYEQLEEAYPTIKLQKYGETDSGEPLHLAIYSAGEDFDLDKIRENNTIVFINNGIHPGESDGIDATMLLFRNLAMDSLPSPKNTILVTIPVYNIGGALNRNSTSRTNQNGPLEYGFRGNARNYDLNRDFIKADTKNTKSFAEIFHTVSPDIFIDTHVSNGADYQYTLTHLFTQHNKLGGELGEYLEKRMIPSFTKSLWEHDWEITPYVNVFNDVPDKGFNQFLDTPRYSTGYATLWNTLGVMIETHMLKPYKVRVEGTYRALLSLVNVSERDWSTIKDLRARAQRKYLTERYYPVNFKVDSSNISRIKFKGYEGESITSEVTGSKRLKYNRDQPYEKEIDYYNNYIPQERIEIPRAYVIPQGWWNVLNVLRDNKIEMTPFNRDTIMEVEVYRIEDYSTSTDTYEGHYQHYNTTVTKTIESVPFRKGDIYIKTFQPGVRYLLETLEPITTDSFFNWNFFDAILQQKEGFSSYVFEDEAYKMLEEDPALKEEFQELKRKDPAFSRNSYEQLNWIYKKSPNYESSHLRYPVFRVSR
ncbi:MAG: M14 family metallopeptidase [Gillisia sp.]